MVFALNIRRTLGFLTLTITVMFFCGCENPTQAQQKANQKSRNKERAAYWKILGYDFDPIKSSSWFMDDYASRWSPDGQPKKKPRPALTQPQAFGVSEQQSPESPSIPIKPTSVPLFSSPPSLLSSPTPILPIAKPLPAIGP
jgi:hypothetical protein